MNHGVSLHGSNRLKILKVLNKILHTSLRSVTIIVIIISNNGGFGI